MNSRRTSVPVCFATLLSLLASVNALAGNHSKLQPRPGAPQGTNNFVLTRGFPQWQPGAPVQVTGVQHADNRRILDGVILLNVGSVTVTEVKLGCALRGVFPGETEVRTFQIFVGEPTAVSIGPNAIGTLGPQSWYTLNALQSARAAGIQEIEAHIGVLSATLATGERYTFSLPANTKFLAGADSDADAKWDAIGSAAVTQAIGQIAATAQSVPVPPQYDLSTTGMFLPLAMTCESQSAQRKRCSGLPGGTPSIPNPGTSCTGTVSCSRSTPADQCRRHCVDIFMPVSF
jgi:hypothetical protein